jgi:hypothetical protein
MRWHGWSGAAAALALSVAVLGSGVSGRADPLVTNGIGLSSCEKLGPDLKPGAGFDHLPNALLFYWTQGYLSAANIYLLNEYTDYVDLSTITEPQITQLVADFCKDNPTGKPISAIDKMIRDGKKIKAKKADAFDPWEH